MKRILELNNIQYTIVTNIQNISNSENNKKYI